MLLKVSDPVSECRRRAEEYGRRARTAPDALQSSAICKWSNAGSSWRAAESMRDEYRGCAVASGVTRTTRAPGGGRRASY
jgi:hypothetical protein